MYPLINYHMAGFQYVTFILLMTLINERHKIRNTKYDHNLFSQMKMKK